MQASEFVRIFKDAAGDCREMLDEENDREKIKIYWALSFFCELLAQYFMELDYAPITKDKGGD